MENKNMVDREFNILHDEFMTGEYGKYEDCPNYRDTLQVIAIQNILNLPRKVESITLESLIEKKKSENR